MEKKLQAGGRDHEHDVPSDVPLLFVIGIGLGACATGDEPAPANAGPRLTGKAVDMLPFVREA